jgi:hypothetical protein
VLTSQQEEQEDDEEDDDDRNNGEGDSDSDVDDDSRMTTDVPRPWEQGRRSRSFASIPNNLQTLCYHAQRYVASHTLFRNPMMTGMDVLRHLGVAWDDAQDTVRQYQARTKECDSLVTFPNRRKLADC